MELGIFGEDPRRFETEMDPMPLTGTEAEYVESFASDRAAVLPSNGADLWITEI